MSKTGSQGAKERRGHDQWQREATLPMVTHAHIRLLRGLKTEVASCLRPFADHPGLTFLSSRTHSLYRHAKKAIALSGFNRSFLFGESTGVPLGTRDAAYVPERGCDREGMLSAKCLKLKILGLNKHGKTNKDL
jgi:hypothetical protein